MPRKFWMPIGFILLCLSASGPAVAIEARRPTPEEAERWLRESVAAYVTPTGATAAAAAVVADGKILAFGTFGWFDPVRQIPVSAHDQLLVGSITKSFVSLAILEFVRQGRIASIDDPINRYLKRYPLPKPFGPSVTIRQLATHTAGLDSPGFGVASNDQREVPASPEYMKHKIPAIVRPPGFKAVYANFGPVILGAALEDITGERLDRLMERLLLHPLEMRDTVLNYDVSGGPRLVYAGIRQNGAVAYAPRTLNVPMIAPAGSIQSTAEDMAKYMNALLGHAPEVLSPRMLALERTPLVVNHPGLSSIGLGVFIDHWNDTPVFTHGGLISGFRSSLTIVPSHDFGVFVAFAGGIDAYTGGPGDPGRATDAMLHLVLGPPQALPMRPVSQDSSRYSGHYWLELRAHSTPEVLFGLDRLIKVSSAESGLLIDSGGGEPKRFVEVAPGLFQGPPEEQRRSELYGFEPDLLLMNKMYAVRVSGVHDPLNWQRFAVTSLVIAALGLLALVWRGAGSMTAVVSGLAAVLAGYVFAWPIWREIDVDTSLFLGNSWRFVVGRIVAWVLLLAGISGILIVIRCARRGDGFSTAEIALLAHRALVALACIGLVCIAQAANLLW